MQIEGSLGKVLLIIGLVTVGLLSYLVYQHAKHCENCDSRSPIFNGTLLPWRRDVEDRLDKLDWDVRALKDRVKYIEGKLRIGDSGSTGNK
jgi:hypothetical protein